MSGLAHWLEEEGIATTMIALVRPHVENLRPPRALWVPFELGRPLGPPNDEVFQRKVLMSALGLLENAESPGTLIDYELDDPDAVGDPTWVCPIAARATDFASEIIAVRPHYESALARFGRTTVGLAALPIESAAAYLSAYALDEKSERPRTGMAPASLMRFCADDVKAFYLEAAGSGPGTPSSRQMTDWFWSQTIAGQTIKDIRNGSAASNDKQRQVLGTVSTVPGIYQ